MLLMACATDLSISKTLVHNHCRLKDWGFRFALIFTINISSSECSNELNHILQQLPSLLVSPSMEWDLSAGGCLTPALINTLGWWLRTASEPLCVGHQVDFSTRTLLEEEEEEAEKSAHRAIAPPIVQVGGPHKIFFPCFFDGVLLTDTDRVDELEVWPIASSAFTGKICKSALITRSVDLRAMHLARPCHFVPFFD